MTESAKASNIITARIFQYLKYFVNQIVTPRARIELSNLINTAYMDRCNEISERDTAEGIMGNICIERKYEDPAYMGAAIIKAKHFCQFESISNTFQWKEWLLKSENALDFAILRCLRRLKRGLAKPAAISQQQPFHNQFISYVEM